MPNVWGVPLAKHSLLPLSPAQPPGLVGGHCLMKEAVGILNPPVIISEETALHGCSAAMDWKSLSFGSPSRSPIC